jgi:molecular chaperone HtpG
MAVTNPIIILVDLEEDGRKCPADCNNRRVHAPYEDMGSLSGMNFYGEMPDSYNLVVNSAHPLVKKVLELEKSALSKDMEAVKAEIEPLTKQKTELEGQKKGKKEEEIPQALKDQIADVEAKINSLNNQKTKNCVLWKRNAVVKQLVDLALLANNMLKGED